MTARDSSPVISGDALSTIAARLMAWRGTTNDALAAAVVIVGACLDETSDGDRPGWLFDKTTDRELATLICADCSVQEQCLELELRLFGAAKLGMWGTLGEDGRRALHPVWMQVREDLAEAERGERR